MGFNSSTSSGLLAIDGSIDYKGATGMGSWNRLQVGMLLGETFIDTTRVLKLQCNMYQCNDVHNNVDQMMRVYQTSYNLNDVQMTGLNQTGNNAYTSNPSSIIKYHSSTEAGVSHSGAVVFELEFRNADSHETAPGDFSVAGDNSIVSMEGYLYKNASANNPLASAVKTATRSLWGVRVRQDDDIRIYIDNRQIYNSARANSNLHQGLFTMAGDWAHVRAELVNGGGGAFANMIFHCIGTGS